MKVAVTKSMKEMANLRILSVESYLRELADADHATFRGQQLDVLPPKNEPRIKIKKQKGIRIDAGTAQKILALILRDHLSAQAIAERFGVGVTTVHRIRDAYRASPHTTQSKGARAYAPNFTFSPEKSEAQP